MNITIIGGGAIGLLTAVYLNKQGHFVKIVTRTDRQACHIASEGLSCQSAGLLLKSEPAVEAASEFKGGQEDLIIVTLKQTQIDFFLEWAKEKVPSPIPLLFLQNGMGHIEKASGYLEHPLLSGVVTHGALKKSDTAVRHTGAGQIIVGGEGFLKKSLNLLLTDDKFFPVIWNSEIELVMKRKLLVNAVVNPLTALYQVNNGQILLNKKLKDLAGKIFNEAVEVLALEKDEWKFVENVIRQTAENTSSMLADRLAKKETELDAITGYLLNLGREKGISCEHILKIHKELKKVELEDSYD
ncbi:2-dehydropantoate 2-reductase [Salipaludibacillus aurantiacus]|uniref:2-dehydropantoate 2-reductase n=1 Tax=Salipaludibacillus aurantiacus TaxID=1601833 RepID=A0A1H9QUL3_9BACI|nr:2-dehydropantoate 2-reductase [Salipaludibacillus aurantiacus]SER64120.1 2-dehydropantoate 2-reductase [Salipaludibacillus aurantiacus]